MAERMAKLRSKERDKRESFRKHVLPFVPAPVLAGLGLLQQPPHCQISLPAQPRISPPISLADLQKIPMGGATSLASTSPLLVACWKYFFHSHSCFIGPMSCSSRHVAFLPRNSTLLSCEETSPAHVHVPQSPLALIWHEAHVYLVN